MRQKTIDKNGAELANRLGVSEARGRALYEQCIKNGVDPTTLQPGQKVPTKPISADSWNTHKTASTKVQRKETIEHETTTELVEIGGELINATLSRKQKLALLARAIKATGEDALDPIELVRAINAHTELSGDTAEGQTYELHLYLDPTAPTPQQLADSVVATTK